MFLQNQKERLIKTKKAQANRKLQPTDWYVTRLAETGTAIPAEISAARAEIKVEVTNYETLVNGAATIQDLETALNIKLTATQEELDRLPAGMKDKIVAYQNT